MEFKEMLDKVVEKKRCHDVIREDLKTSKNRISSMRDDFHDNAPLPSDEYIEKLEAYDTKMEVHAVAEEAYNQVTQELTDLKRLLRQAMPDHTSVAHKGYVIETSASQHVSISRLEEEPC